MRSVDAGLRVGGPATAAVGWVEDLAAYAAKTGAPLDFVATHLYGAPPLDLRPALARQGHHDAAIWWTKWGAHPRLSNPVAESLYAAAFLARGMRSAAGRVDLERSNIAADWEAMSGGADWPDEAQWAALREANRLEPLEPPRQVVAAAGAVELAFDLPMPSLSLVELDPA